ncbi:hypothetical protein DEAB109302_13395 [Dermacoccus abyssi]
MMISLAFADSGRCSREATSAWPPIRWGRQEEPQRIWNMSHKGSTSTTHTTSYFGSTTNA